MGRLIVCTILLLIGLGALGALTGDMTVFFVLLAIAVVVLLLIGILYYVLMPRERRVNKYNPFSPTLHWMNTAGSILIAANNRTSFYRLAGWRYNNDSDREIVQKILWEYWGIQGHETAIE